MRDHLSLTDLVTGARNGDTQAWDALVDRYAPLIWSICRRYQLADADADRADHSVWAQLADQLDTIRDPAALQGWLATTTLRECGRILRAAQGTNDAALAPDAQIVPGDTHPAQLCVTSPQRTRSCRRKVVAELFMGPGDSRRSGRRTPAMSASPFHRFSARQPTGPPPTPGSP